MKKCIICNTEKEEDKFNIEHVIPESAGGSFEIDNVCEECNSLLGSTIDNNFLDNFFVKVYLSKFDIKSKKGKLPKLWPKLPTRKNPKIKGIPQYNPYNNQFQGWKYNSAIIELNGSKHLVFDSKEEIDDVLRKFSDTELDKDDIREKFYNENYLEEHQELPINWTIKLDDLFFEAIKIAYEFASYVIGDDYLDDSFAVEFRDILLNSSKYNMEDIDKYFFNFNCEESPFNETLHSIFLMNVDDSLVVSINLFNFVFSIEVSKNLNLVPDNLFGYFLLNNIDGSISEYNVTMDSLKIVELYNRLKFKRKINMDMM